MKEIMAVQVGGKYLVVPKLIGAMLVVIAAIMIVVATADVVLTWDRIKAVEKCVINAELAGNGSQSAELAALTQMQTCAILGQQAGVQIRLDGAPVPNEEVWNAMLPKVAAWLWWILVLIIALLVYQSGKLVFPIREEKYTEVVAPPAVVQKNIEKKKKTRKKRATRRKSKR